MQEYHINEETGSEALYNMLSLKSRNLLSYMIMNFVRRCPFNKMQLFYSEGTVGMLVPSFRICMLQSQLLIYSLTLSFLISKVQYIPISRRI